MSRNNHPGLSLPSSILAGVILILATPLGAQEASYTYIDQKGPYSNPREPMLTALTLPKVGTTFEVEVPSPSGGFSIGCFFGDDPCYLISSQYFLALGLSNPDVPLPALNGFQFTSAEFVVPTPSNSGSPVTMSFPIPNSPELVGLRFYQQVLAVTDGLDVSYQLSRGGVGVIGN